MPHHRHNPWAEDGLLFLTTRCSSYFMANKRDINIWSAILVVCSSQAPTGLSARYWGCCGAPCAVARCFASNGIHSTPMRKVYATSKYSCPKRLAKMARRYLKMGWNIPRGGYKRGQIIRLDGSLATTLVVGGRRSEGGWENEMLGRVSVFLDTQCLAWLLPAQRLTRKCHPKSTLTMWHNESAPMIVEQHKKFLGIIPEGSGDVATQWIVFASGDGVPGMVWTLEKVFLCAALCSRRQPELEAQKQSTALVNLQTEGSKSLGKLQNCFITAFHSSSSRTPSWNFISTKKLS